MESLLRTLRALFRARDIIERNRRPNESNAQKGNTGDGTQERLGLSRAVFWVVVSLGVLLRYLWLVAFIGSFVATVALFAVGAATNSTFLSFTAAGVAVILLAVVVALFFIGAAKVL